MSDDFWRFDYLGGDANTHIVVSIPMDAPKHKVSWLESFPPDIWAYFVWYLPGEQLGRLVMTGATFLCQKLKSPHVVKSIKLGEDFMVFKSYPMFLNDFPSLEELSIWSCNDDWSSKLGLTIDSLPSGLRKLQLSGSWGQSTEKLFGANGATLKLSEHLPHLETLQLRLLHADSWLTHSPPTLTKLSLGRWEGTAELPSTLIHFESSYAELSTDTFVRKLPPSLETFIIKVELNALSLIVPLLPPSTLKFYCELALVTELVSARVRKLLEQLPKSLTCLKTPEYSEISFGKNPEFASLLPSTLTVLELGASFPDSAWSLLPPNLTELSLNTPQSTRPVVSELSDDRGVHHEIHSFCFESLPRSITTLRLRISSHGRYFLCGPPATSDHSYFPPQLAYLKIPDIQLAPETAKLLPSTLTFLEVGNFCELVCECLPKSIQTLISSQALMTPNLINLLPKSLTFLQITMHVTAADWYDYNTGKSIDSISKVPNYDIHAKCLSNSYDWKDALLPPKLVHLEISKAYDLADSFLLHQQHLKLQVLNLSYAKHFSDLCIPHLSPHLTTLDLECSSNISGKSFCYLPKCLTDLTLNHSEHIFDSDIQHLPRTLKQISLSRAIHLTELCIPDLPPRLEWLDMSDNALITPSCYFLLPYPLRASQLFKPAEFRKWYIERGVVRRD